MAEPPVQKKSKKKKKKSAVNNNTSHPESACPPVPNASISNGIKDVNNSINEILPQKVGMKTVFKEVEVTMTQCEAENAAAAAPGKKKKKKKKSKQPAEITPETPNSEKDNSNLLNFCENRIELVNHPEISVTVSNVSQAQENGKTEETEGKTVNGNGNNECTNTAASSNSKKKKKKKKKKSGNSESTADVPAAETKPAEEATYSAPTYVKLPATGDSCFLVVSHESFSNGNKLIIGNDDEKAKLSQNNVNLVSNQKETTKEVPQNNVPSFNSNIHIGNSVSIFPVHTNLNSETLSEKQTDTAKDPASLEIIANKVKNEAKIDATVNKTVTDSNTVNENNDEELKLKKAELKAERRAKQEAQRAAKLAKCADKISSIIIKDSSLPKNIKHLHEIIPSKDNKSVADKSTSNTSDKEAFNKVRLFSHLPQYKSSLFYSKQVCDMSSKLHPSVLEIGSKYSKGIICGSNARCVALLGAFREVIKDFITPPDKNFSRELESTLQTYLHFLGSCRPLSASMINAVKLLKHHINHIPSELDEVKAKENLCSYINDFVNVEILLAKEAISNSGSAKIVNGDIILVFAFSSLVKDVLCKAYNQNKAFRVVVVDSRPKMEGLKMLQCLVAQGIQCFYMHINAVSYIMKEVSKVIIGAHALLANGCVMSRLGCKQIALVASSYSVPVLVCCETYKFCERVLTDSFVHNELGDLEELVHTSLVQNDSLQNWHTLSSLKLLNLLYDVTPSDLISMVITEKGDLPCTSVPVVLRVRHAGLHE